MRWTVEHDEILRARYPHERAADVAQALGRAITAVYARAGILGLKKSDEFKRSDASGRRWVGCRGNAGMFRPGHASWNKGKHYCAGGRSAETRFGPGHRPHTWVPVGTETMRSGYLARKVSDDKTPSRRNWKFLHVIAWEAVYGPVPDGYAVTFVNGDRTDIRIENLQLVERRELMLRNTIHHLPEELADLCRLKGAVVRQINQRAKAHEKQNRGSSQSPVRDARGVAGRGKADGSGPRASRGRRGADDHQFREGRGRFPEGCGRAADDEREDGGQVLRVDDAAPGVRAMNARRWTPEEDARLAEMYPTTRTEHVAEALGRSRMAVYLRAQQLNVRKADGCHGNARNPQPWPEDRNASA